jgi:dihydrodipicolinate synthase/N-acetylneuraminate lyase
VTVPALLYNIPQCTHAILDHATVDALATNPRVLGIKAACATLGIGNGLPAPPLAALGAGGRARVAAIVRRHAAALTR